MISSQNSQVFDLVPTSTAAICAIVADKRTVSEKQEIRVAIEKGAASVASKAFDMPPVTSYMKEVSPGTLFLSLSTFQMAFLPLLLSGM